LRQIAALYAIEAEISGQPAEQRLAERQARSKRKRKPTATLH